MFKENQVKINFKSKTPKPVNILHCTSYEEALKMVKKTIKALVIITGDLGR